MNLTQDYVDAMAPGYFSRVLQQQDALHRYADELADAEPQTEAFVMCLDPQEENAVWLFEWFSGPDGQDKHRASEPFAGLIAELSEVLGQEPQVLPLEPLRMHINYSPQA